MDDDSSSVQSQDTEKATDIHVLPSKLPTGSKESSPAPVPASASSKLPAAVAKADDSKSSSSTNNSNAENNVNLVNEPVKKRRDNKELEIVLENGVEVAEKSKVVHRKEKGPAPRPPSMISSSTSTTSSDKSESERKKDEAPKAPSPKKEAAPPPPPPPAIDTQKPSTPKMKERSVSNDDLLEQRLTKDLGRKEKPLSKSHSIPASTTSDIDQGHAMKEKHEINRSYSYEDRQRSSSEKESSIANKALNTSTITINSDHSSSETPPSSNSLASANVNQVTVITSHPPVIVDNSILPEPPPGFGNDIVIVSTNNDQSSNKDTDEDQDNTSRNSSPSKYIGGKIHLPESTPKGRKLDESEVLIVSPGFVDTELTIHEEGDEIPIRNEEEPDNVPKPKGNRSSLFDTSHVSVVTLGEEEVKVKDSSNAPVAASSPLQITEPHIDKSNTKMGNGQLVSDRREDVNIIVNNNKKNGKRNSPDSSVGSMDSRNQSECGSVRSTNTPPVIVAKLDRSDVESIATTTSHDSREPEEEPVQLRRKPEPAAPAPVPDKNKVLSPNSKKELDLANLRKKTRKRTRKFEIDGVQVTTTTSKVIYDDEESNTLYEDHILRKQELRELKLLQKQEKKQFLELKAKESIAKEQQEKKFEQERIALERTYDADMEVLARQHRQTVEKYEQQQEAELRNTSKKIRAEQERELKLVRTIFI